MSSMVRVAGTALAFVATAGLADYAFNDARLLYGAMGRDRLAAACLPELRRALESRGFAPFDVEFDARPRVSLALGGPRRFGAAFTFQDGGAATRIDGTVECDVDGSEVRVDVRTSAPAVRLGLGKGRSRPRVAAAASALAG